MLGLRCGLHPKGWKLRVFNLIDEFTRECHCIHADRSITAADVLRLLQEAIERNSPPGCIRSDNGPEFIARAIQDWLAENAINTIYIDPGCPWQNGYAESFNSRFRIECLDRELLYTLSESRVVFADWRNYYNNIRPHRSLACRAHRSLPETNQLKAWAPVVLRTPSAQAFQKTNINPRKLSHNLWAN